MENFMKKLFFSLVYFLGSVLMLSAEDVRVQNLRNNNPKPIEIKERNAFFLGGGLGGRVYSNGTALSTMLGFNVRAGYDAYCDYKNGLRTYLDVAYGFDPKSTTTEANAESTTTGATTTSQFNQFVSVTANLDYLYHFYHGVNTTAGLYFGVFLGALIDITGASKTQDATTITIDSTTKAVTSGVAAGLNLGFNFAFSNHSTLVAGLKLSHSADVIPQINYLYRF